MLQYVNGFSCAMDSEKDELIIKLLQRSPDFTDDNDGVIMDEVATIVMGKVTAQCRVGDTVCAEGEYLFALMPGQKK